MDRETFKVEIVTPCFLGGARGTAEWRSASIRGQLRWWFRAVGGTQWRGDLDHVRREEARLFGSTDRRSLLRLRIVDSPKPAGASFGSRLFAAQLAKMYQEPFAEDRLRILGERGEEGSNPLHYLAFGPVAKGRQYLPPLSRASFEIQLGPGAPKKNEEIRKVFGRALWAWLNLGGIGSKSRKGFGSLRCDTNDFYQDPTSLQDFEAQVKSLLVEGRGFQAGPEWTHFSAGSRVFIGEGGRTWEEAMERLGVWLIGFRRRYGFPRDLRSFNGIALAGRDYEWAAPKGTQPRMEVPDRAGFGLPLPFRRGSAGETVTWGARPKPGEPKGKDNDARRASPLLLHVSKLGGSFVPVLTHLPSRFLPKNSQLKFRGPFPTLFPETPQQRSIITTFLEDLQKKQLIREVLP
jgi:CRISPR-associated protein Cmr1